MAPAPRDTGIAFAGAVLTGGRSSRMGRDKATLPVDGVPMAARVAPIALFRYHRSLLLQRAMQAHPLQPRLVAETLLLDYRALF